MKTDNREIYASSSIIRFGRYEVDLQRRELRRGGLMIRLQSQPFTLLALLIERPNQVVTRLEMRDALWGDDVTVDFEQSLSSAIKKLRESLDDSATNPRFIETVARRGYRFIAPVAISNEDHLSALTPTESTQEKVPEATTAEVTPNRNNTPEALTPPAPVHPQTTYSATSKSIWKNRPLLWTTRIFVGFLLCATTYFYVRTFLFPPTYRISQVTSSDQVFTGTQYGETVPSIFTDGLKIYFPMFERGQSLLSSAMIGDGETNTIHLPVEISMPIPTDISPDLTRLLVMDRLGLTSEHSLWITPVYGGGAQRVANTLAHDAIWTKDGKHILFAKENHIYQERDDGEEVTLLATLPARAFWLRLSPDGQRLRFTLSNVSSGSRSLWEMRSDGSNLHKILLNWRPNEDVCCGSWTEDGRHFIFSAAEEGRSDLWEQDEDILHLLPTTPFPRRLTDGPLDFQAPMPGRSSSTIFAVGVQQSSRQFRFDPSTHQVLPNLPLPPNVQRTEFSSDGRWMAWIDQKTGSLWRSRSDGTLRLQLTTPPSEVWMMKWSPDASRIAYVARTRGTPWRIHIISAIGGEPWVPLQENRDQTDADWSPDGRYLLFGRLPNSMKSENAPKNLYLYDLSRHQLTVIPNSQGVTSPRFSPDGKHIAAIKNDGGQLVLFDTATQTWRLLLEQSVSDPVWSHDGKSLFFLAFQPEGRTVYRLHVPEEKLERMVGIEDIRLNDVGVFWFYSLAPGDIPLICFNTSNASIYRIDKDR